MLYVIDLAGIFSSCGAEHTSWYSLLGVAPRDLKVLQNLSFVACCTVLLFARVQDRECSATNTTVRILALPLCCSHRSNPGCYFLTGCWPHPVHGLQVVCCLPRRGGDRQAAVCIVMGKPAMFKTCSGGCICAYVTLSGHF